MKNFLISLFAMIVIAAALLFLARDPIAKFAIETEGSKAWGAPIKISDINIDVFNKTIRLKNFNLANPDDPKSVLAKADELYIEITPKSFIDKKIEINHLEITGLSLLRNFTIGNTFSSSPGSSVALPNFNLPDAGTLIASKKSAIKTDIEHIKTTINSIEQKWKNKLASLPNQNKLDEYKTRIKQLKGKGDFFEKLAAAKDLEKIYRELRRDVKQIKGLEGDFKQDRDRLKNQISTARALPQKYSRELVQSLGMDSSQLSNLASAAFAGGLKDILNSLLEAVETNGDNEVRSSPLSYEVVIHQAVIEGPVFEQIPGLLLTANLNDLSYPLENANKATSVIIKGSINGKKGLQMSSTIDHRNGIDDSFEIEASSLQLQELTLAEHPDISIVLNKALLNMSGKLSLQGEEISGQLVQSFSDGEFITALPPESSKAAEVLADVLAAVSEFDLTLDFSGTLSNPALSFRTSKLDKLISKSVLKKVSREVQRLQSDASHALSQQLDPQILALFSQVESLNDIERQLESQKKTGAVLASSWYFQNKLSHATAANLY